MRFTVSFDAGEECPQETAIAVLKDLCKALVLAPLDKTVGLVRDDNGNTIGNWRLDP